MDGCIKMIINIRGTSGTGKSTLVRNLFNAQKTVGVREDYVLGKRDVLKPTTKKKVVGYQLANGTHVVGRYETKCGGCDTIKMQDQVQRLVEEAWATEEAKTVVFEGLLTCNSYGRWKELAEREPFMFLFLDTPIEVCLDAVVARRLEAGKTRKEAEPDERTIYNLTRMYDTNQKTYKKCVADGMKAFMVNREAAWEILKEACGA